MEKLKVITAERPDAPRRRARKSTLMRVAEAVLRELMRLRLAVWLLIVMGVTMIVGSIFPQGYDAEMYIESWGQGRYEALTRWGLLNLFHTKYFLVLGIILLLNLAVCSVVRLLGKRGVSVAQSSAPSTARIIDMGGEPDTAISKGVRALTERGYYVSRAAGGMLSARRGPWPEGVSLLYHLAMAIAIIGFIASALHSFEGDVTLYPGGPVVVKTTSAETGWQKFKGRLGSLNIGAWHPFGSALPDTTAWQGRQVELTLNEFITEWELYEGKYYPKDWLSDLSIHVTGHGPEVMWPSRLIEVNRPIRAGGLTFYQMAYEQEFDVVVSRDGAEVERVRANAYVPFTLDSVGGMFFPGTLRVGTLYQKYRPTELVVPHVSLKWQPPEEEAEAAIGSGEGTEGALASEGTDEEHGAEVTSAELDTVGQASADQDTAEGEVVPADTVAVSAHAAPPERIEIGDLSAEEPLELEGYSLTLENPYEGSVLSYRHDPGVPLLYIAITVFLIGLAIRTYWPSYRVNLWISEGPDGARGEMTFRATGMLGEPEIIEEEITAALGRRTE